MKHLSRDKLAKHHRFSYLPRFYKQDSEAFQQKVSEIKRQLDNNVAFEDVSSQIIEMRKLRKKRTTNRWALVGLLAAMLTTLFVFSITIVTTAVLFVLAFAFIKLSKKR